MTLNTFLEQPKKEVLLKVVWFIFLRDTNTKRKKLRYNKLYQKFLSQPESYESRSTTTIFAE